MRLVVTRPRSQAEAWVETLRRLGVDAQALPLIAIEPGERRALDAAWAALGESPSSSAPDAPDLVVFVSPNAVAEFFRRRPAGAAWPAAVAAAAPGPGSAAALAAHGVATVLQPPADAAQFDSESLWPRLQHRVWRRVLVVRGDGGRDWLAARLRERGAEVTFLQAYRRAVPRLDAGEARLLADALAAPAQHLWHFSSSQAADHLQQLAPGTRDHDRALATHPRIAERLRALGWGDVRVIAVSAEAAAQALVHAQARAAPGDAGAPVESRP